MPESSSRTEEYDYFPEHGSISRVGNTATITKREGAYTILYINHKAGPMHPEQIPKSAKGVVLETGSIPWANDPEHALTVCKLQSQYWQLIPWLEERRIPLYLADVCIGDTADAVDTIVIGVEAGIGAALLLSVPDKHKEYKKKGEQDSLSRRDALKLGLRAVGGAWLSTPAVSYFGNCASHSQGIGEHAAAGFQKFTHRIHPEYLVSRQRVRNAVIAHKEQWLMEQMDAGHLATVLGAMHRDIEHDIQYPRERMNFLRTLKPVLGSIVEKNSFYKISRFDFNGEKWVHTQYEVPELKELVE